MLCGLSDTETRAAESIAPTMKAMQVQTGQKVYVPDPMES